jgi:hypothetical protein
MTIQKAITHLLNYWGWYLFFGYLILMYVVYKGAVWDKHKEIIGDELDNLDESESFYHNEKY